MKTSPMKPQHVAEVLQLAAGSDWFPVTFSLQCLFSCGSELHQGRDSELKSGQRIKVHAWDFRNLTAAAANQLRPQSICHGDERISNVQPNTQELVSLGPRCHLLVAGGCARSHHLSPKFPSTRGCRNHLALSASRTLSLCPDRTRIFKLT
ncbi:unnamed protein product [Pleuronectes platessa]|uniref:Uncharacterized protein n=1 Tax=Pleuronectes platessa TaxID=8262 RepID=A0A9N7UNS5_PLEPL|nr:unnamed protein product [Pleuronectes platessa]